MFALKYPLVVACASICGATVPALDAAAQPLPGKRLTLDQVVAAAQRGPRSQAASEATREAEGARAEASGLRFPRLGFLGLIAPSPKIDCVDAACTTTEQEDPSVSLEGVFGRLELSLTQPLYTFGKLDAASDASRHAVGAARSLEDATAGEAAVDAAVAYFGLKLARESRAMLDEGRERVVDALDKVNAKLAAGSPEVTLQDRFRIETLAAEVELRLVDARRAEATALAGLRVLIGDGDADIDDSVLEPIAFAVGSEDAYASRARAAQPEVRAVAAGTGAAAELARLESSRYFPDIVLVAGVNLARSTSVDEPPSAFANDPYNTVSAAAAVAVRWTLDPFAHRGRVKKAEARSRRARWLLRAVGDRADFQAREAFAALRASGERLEISRRGERSARAWLASETQAEAIGTGKSKDLADAYLAFFAARGRILEEIHDWNLAVFRLRRVIGEFTAAGGV